MQQRSRFAGFGPRSRATVTQPPPPPPPARNSRSKLTRRRSPLLLLAAALIVGGALALSHSPAHAQQPPTPGVPTALTVTGNGVQTPTCDFCSGVWMTVSWTAPTGTVTSYEVGYTRNASVNLQDAGNDPPEQGWVNYRHRTSLSSTRGAFLSHYGTSIKVIGLIRGTAYRVRVRTMSGENASAWVEVSGTTGGTVPSTVAPDIWWDGHENEQYYYYTPETQPGQDSPGEQTGTPPASGDSVPPPVSDDSGTPPGEAPDEAPGESPASGNSGTPPGEAPDEAPGESPGEPPGEPPASGDSGTQPAQQPQQAQPDGDAQQQPQTIQQNPQTQQSGVSLTLRNPQGSTVGTSCLSAAAAANKVNASSRGWTVTQTACTP